MQHFALIITHLLALAAWLWFCRWEARRNAELITANGSQNSLGLAFHVKRTLIRLAASLLLSAAPLRLWPAPLPSIGLFAGLWGWFAFYFGPALNELRGKPRYYVSSSATTSLTDKLLWKLAGAKAPRLVQVLGWVALGLGVVIYIAAMVTSCR